MKKIFCFIVLLFFVSTTDAQSINWLKNFKEASKLAQETGKPLLLDFTASWCEPCQEMDKTFWTRSDVIEIVNDFIAVKVNFDTEKGLANKYSVSSIPNVTIADPWGNGLTYNRGFGSNTQRYLTQFAEIPKDFSSIKEPIALLETDKSNVALLNKVADFYSQNKLLYQSNIYYKRLLKLETDSAQRETLIFNIAFNYLRAGVPDEAEEFFKDFQKTYPQSDKNELVLFGLTFVNIQKEKLKNAEKLFAKLKSDYPNSIYIKQLEGEISKAKENKK